MKPQTIFIILFLIAALSFSMSQAKAQSIKEEIELLKVDTSYAYFQYHSLATAKKFSELFSNSKEKRVVIFHFGASHIQAEIVTSRAKEYLYENFGNAGPGFLFPFSAAKTYGSINYKTSHTGTWTSAKSFQLMPKIPLGVRGMTVETRDPEASFSLAFNTPFPKEEYELLLFFDNNAETPDFKVATGDFDFIVDETVKSAQSGKNFVLIPINQEITALSVELLPSEKPSTLFRFYGMSLEKKRKSGVLYHSLGVGASPFEAVLNLEKLKEQSEVLQPDLVILDYGTNNILYQNKVAATLPKNVSKAISNFRAINPEVLIVLTSTQDLFYKRKYIDAGIDFAKMMDSLAKENGVMYWNFYDLSRGYGQIKNWEQAGYAQNDYIHLTSKGYRLKGYLLNTSILNTLKYHSDNPSADSLHLPLKNYDAVREQVKVVAQSTSTRSGGRSSTYKVKRGDTLSEIAAKYGVRVSTLKRLNNLRSDLIRIGQTLKIR
ncbi:MAG: LysM peptidoglycan-binding domain-containing protein [Bacteroidetes bacterium]|nr:LysM peptidoglycan-binding domain-containing protein [Bacteroidota bacterium]